MFPVISSTIKNSIAKLKCSNRTDMNYSCFYCIYGWKTRIKIICNRSWPSRYLFLFHSVDEEIMIKLPVKILSPKSPEPIQPRTILRFTDNNVLFLALSADGAQNHVLFSKLGQLLLIFLYLGFLSWILLNHRTTG